MSLNRNSHPTYDDDYFGWINQQANFLRNKEYEKVDLTNLIEEIESLGISEKRRLESFLKILLLHLLKCKYQPTRHSKSWDLSIKNSSRQFLRTLKENPSLKPKLKEILEDAYFSARLEAAQETGLDEETFPENCPWTIEEIIEKKGV